MSRDWFILTRRPLENSRRHPLADPLEREEWQGLGWILPLLGRIAGHRHSERAERRNGRAALQTRAPFLIR